MSEHDVTVDHEAAEGELLAYAEQPQGSAGGGAAGQGGEAPTGGWTKEADLACTMLFDVVVPAWEVPRDRRADVQEKLEAVLDQWFPGGIGLADQWGPLPQLLFTLGGVVVTCGVDYQTFTLKPMRYPAQSTDEEMAAAAGGTGAGFSTVGGDDGADD